MNICIIGNSHVGALKRAWVLIGKNFPSINITFFAHRGGMSNLRVSDNKLIPRDDQLLRSFKFTSDGLDNIDTSNYNLFLIYGGGLRPYFKQSNIFYSNQVIGCLFDDLNGDIETNKVLNLLRKVTNKQIFLGHDPLRSPKEMVDDMHTNAYEYESGINYMNENYYNKFSITLVAQPLKTILNGKFTHFKYSNNSERLAIGKRNDNHKHKNDNKHMNTEFGKVWLSDFLSSYINLKH